MVVVEDGQHYMNEQIEVVVTECFTNRSWAYDFFAKPAHAGRGINDRKDNHPKKTIKKLSKVRT